MKVISTRRRTSVAYVSLNFPSSLPFLAAGSRRVACTQVENLFACQLLNRLFLPLARPSPLILNVRLRRKECRLSCGSSFSTVRNSIPPDSAPTSDGAITATFVPRISRGSWDGWASVRLGVRAMIYRVSSCNTTARCDPANFETVYAFSRLRDKLNRDGCLMLEDKFQRIRFSKQVDIRKGRNVHHHEFSIRCTIMEGFSFVRVPSTFRILNMYIYIDIFKIFRNRPIRYGVNKSIGTTRRSSNRWYCEWKSISVYNLNQSIFFFYGTPNDQVYMQSFLNHKHIFFFSPGETDSYIKDRTIDKVEWHLISCSFFFLDRYWIK